jgi:hypothetical protein
VYEPKKKGGAALLIGLGMPKPKGGADDVEVGMDEGEAESTDGYAPSDEEAMAAEDIMAAVHSKDAGALAKALCNLMDLHSVAKDTEELSEEE